MAVKGSALVTDPYYKAVKTTGSTEYADDLKTSTITTNGDVNIDTPEDDTEAFTASPTTVVLSTLMPMQPQPEIKPLLSRATCWLCVTMATVNRTSTVQVR